MHQMMSENRNILICTDFSKHAESALIHAMDQAKKYKAKLHLFHVIMPSDPCGNSSSNPEPDSGQAQEPYESENNLVQQTIGALKQKYSDVFRNNVKDYEYIVKIGTPDIEIVRYAREKNIDIIILGALGIPEKDRATRVRTAANVSKFAPCQVIVVQMNTRDSFGI
jgi:nucleotide-binding universal stress UspA family protein